MNRKTVYARSKCKTCRMWTKTEMRLGLASQCCESVRSRGIGLRITTEVQCKERFVQYGSRMSKHVGLVPSRLIVYNTRS